MPKRDDPSTPTKENPGKDGSGSPLSKHKAKRLFHGGTAMDVDPSASDKERANQQAKERDERRKRIELQKKTGVKTTGKNKGGTTGTDDEAANNERAEGDDEPTVASESGRGRSTLRKPPGKGNQRSISRNRAEFDKAFPPPPKGSGRRRSVPPKKKKTDQHRSSSIDSRTSSKSKKSDSEDSQSGDKRKRQSTDPSAKSAKFQEGIPDNEGKTASTRKNLRAKRAADKAGGGCSYSDKAKAPEKTSWKFEKVVYYSLKVGKCASTTGEVYSRLGGGFGILLREDSTCAIANFHDRKKKPLRSAAEFNFTSHGTFQQYFTVDEETDWQFDDGIKADKPRSFLGSFILLSDVDPVDLFKFTRVDLRKQLKGNGSMGIKEIQQLHTVKGFVLMGVHGSTYAPEVAHKFRHYLIKAEEAMLYRKKLYEEEGLGKFDSMYEEYEEDWKMIEFPDIRSVTSYPRGGPWEETKKGEDTKWKLAHHFEFSESGEDRVQLAVAEFKKSGMDAKLFGPYSSLEPISKSRASGLRDAYVDMIPDHQNTNRSVGNVTLAGAINLDAEVAIQTEPAKEGETIKLKTMTMRDVIRKLYVKIGARKFPAFLYIFKNYTGQHQLWFWDTVREIRDWVEMFRQNGPAYIWHRMMHWGWDKGSCKRLFLLSFDSTTATTAMNSQWSAARQKVISVGAGSDAASRLRFGTSPFILRTGEDKESRIKPPSVQRSDLKAGDLGGRDFDDLKSVGDQSDTETVFEDYNEYDDYGEDDVSEMGDDDGFDNEDDDGVSEAEQTRNEEDRYGAHGSAVSDDDEVMDDGDEDSGFSTKASGRYTQKKSDTDATVQALLAENQRLRDESSRKLAEMESKFMEMLHAKYAENAAAAKGNVHSNEHKDADGDMKTPAKESEGSEKEEDKRGTDANSGSQRPGATGGSNAGGDSSQTGEAGSASAGIK